MKSKLLLILFFFFLFSLQAQFFKAGVIAGGNLAQVDGDEIYGFNRIGANAGGIVILPLGNNFSLSLEMLYNQKGSYQKSAPTFYDSLSGQYKLALDYADIPLLIHYKDKNFMNVGTGFSWGNLVRLREWEHGKKIKWKAANGPYKNYDINWIIDVDFPMFKELHKLKFNFRYSYSLVKIRTREYSIPNGDTWKRDQFNNVLTFRLQYIFNEPKPDIKVPD